MSTVISIEPDEVAALAAELATLATQLAGEVALCTSTAASLRGALGGDEGWHAGAAGTAWAQLLLLVQGRTAGVAGMLTAAVDSYRASDGLLAGCIAAERIRPGSAASR